MNVTELFRANQLEAALAQAVADVKSSPGSVESRTTLAELYCFSGDFPRADKQLATLESLHAAAVATLGLIASAGQGAPALIQALDPQQRRELQVVQWVREFRQLIRAAQWRHDCWMAQRLPEFPAPPDEEVRGRLAALVALRAGSVSRAAELLETAEAERPAVPVVCNGEPLADFRDVDDLGASVLELLTPGGVYFWLPISALLKVEFAAVAGLRDALWRPASFHLRGGVSGSGFVPALYWHAGDPPLDPVLRLGRAAEWEELADGMFRGLGGRVFAGGETLIPLMHVRMLEFAPPSSDAGEA